MEYFAHGTRKLKMLKSIYGLDSKLKQMKKTLLIMRSGQSELVDSAGRMVLSDGIAAYDALECQSSFNSRTVSTLMVSSCDRNVIRYSMLNTGHTT